MVLLIHHARGWSPPRWACVRRGGAAVRGRLDARALVLGPTTYAFSTMLVAFVVGIACGAALASRVADRVARPLVWLASTLMLAALGAFGAWLLVGELPLAIAGIVSAPDVTLTAVVARQALLVGALLLDPTNGPARAGLVEALTRRAKPSARHACDALDDVQCGPLCLLFVGYAEEEEGPVL